MRYRRLLVIGAVFAVWVMLPNGSANSTLNQYSGSPPPPSPPPTPCLEVFACANVAGSTAIEVAHFSDGCGIGGFISGDDCTTDVNKVFAGAKGCQIVVGLVEGENHTPGGGISILCNGGPK